MFVFDIVCALLHQFVFFLEFFQIFIINNIFVWWKVNAGMLGIALRAMYQHTKMAASWRKEKTKLQQMRQVNISYLGIL